MGTGHLDLKSAILGTLTAGNWHRIEMRIKLNEIGESDGEFMFFFDGELTNHLSGLSNMATENHALTHGKFWVFNRNPGQPDARSIYFKNYAITKFSPDVAPNVFTTAGPTEAPSTTHPITTTTSTAGKAGVLAKMVSHNYQSINIKEAILIRIWLSTLMALT